MGNRVGRGTFSGYYSIAPELHTRKRKIHLVPNVEMYTFVSVSMRSPNYLPSFLVTTHNTQLKGVEIHREEDKEEKH